MELKNKTAVIIGASGNIGRHISYTLALEGVKVILVGRDNNHLVVLKRKIIELGGVAESFTLNFLKEKEVIRLVKIIKRKYLVVDFLIHTAGIGIYENIEKMTYDKWKLSMDVNVNAVFLVNQKFISLLVKSKNAHILAMGSGMGKIAIAGRSAYCASKFALRGMMLSLAKEYKNTNIHFNLLTLGSVLTSFGPLSLEEKIKKQARGKKYLRPAYLAHLICEKLKNDSLGEETSIYPEDYFKQSIGGKV